jgi:hypothetical protein
LEILTRIVAETIAAALMPALVDYPRASDVN